MHHIRIAKVTKEGEGEEHWVQLVAEGVMHAVLLESFSLASVWFRVSGAHGRNFGWFRMLSCSGVSAFLMASGVCWVVLSGGDVLTS
jgi:hypothetical protein